MTPLNQPRYTLDELQAILPEFIDDTHPKGESKDRGQATVAIALFIIWLRKKELHEKTS